MATYTYVGNANPLSSRSGMLMMNKEILEIGVPNSNVSPQDVEHAERCGVLLSVGAVVTDLSSFPYNVPHLRKKGTS